MSDDNQPRLPFDQPKRRKPPKATLPPPKRPSRWKRVRIRARAWARNASRWVVEKTRDKVVEYVIAGLVGVAMTFFGVDALMQRWKQPTLKTTPPVIEKGWEPKVHKGR